MITVICSVYLHDCIKYVKFTTYNCIYIHIINLEVHLTILRYSIMHKVTLKTFIIHFESHKFHFIKLTKLKYAWSVLVSEVVDNAD